MRCLAVVRDLYSSLLQCFDYRKCMLDGYEFELQGRPKFGFILAFDRIGVPRRVLITLLLFSFEL